METKRFDAKEDSDLAKKDVNKTITIDKATHDLALKVAGEMDCSFSEMVRTAICLASPQLVHSLFMRKISAEDINVSKVLP